MEGRHRWTLAQEIEAVTVTFEFAVRARLARIDGYGLASGKGSDRNDVPRVFRGDVRREEIYLARGVSPAIGRTKAGDVKASAVTHRGELDLHAIEALAKTGQ